MDIIVTDLFDTCRQVWRVPSIRDMWTPPPSNISRICDANAMSVVQIGEGQNNRNNMEVFTI